MTPGPIVRFTRDYVTYRPKQQAAFFVQESDWARLRRLLAAVPAKGRPYQVVASVCAGLFCSAVFCLIALYATGNAPEWAFATGWSVGVSGGLLAIALGILDHKIGQLSQTSVTEVLTEMDNIEATIEPVDDVPVPEAEPQPMRRELWPQSAIRDESRAVVLLGDDEIQINDRVFHREHGPGVVVEIDRHSGKPVAVVRFGDGSTRRVTVGRGYLSRIVGGKSERRWESHATTE